LGGGLLAFAIAAPTPQAMHSPAPVAAKKAVAAAAAAGKGRKKRVREPSCEPAAALPAAAVDAETTASVAAPLAETAPMNENTDTMEISPAATVSASSKKAKRQRRSKGPAAAAAASVTDSAAGGSSTAASDTQGASAATDSDSDVLMSPAQTSFLQELTKLMGAYGSEGSSTGSGSGSKRAAAVATPAEKRAGGNSANKVRVCAWMTLPVLLALCCARHDTNITAVAEFVMVSCVDLYVQEGSLCSCTVKVLMRSELLSLPLCHRMRLPTGRAAMSSLQLCVRLTWRPS
jgi:hypothetical protein